MTGHRLRPMIHVGMFGMIHGGTRDVDAYGHRCMYLKPCCVVLRKCRCTAAVGAQCLKAPHT